jgi:hypothetical protein
MKKKVGDYFQDVYPPLVVITETRARTNFAAARSHAITLLRIHDQKTGGGRGRPPQELEALKRSALILAVTAWESFVEDTVVSQLEARLAAARDPTELRSTFDHVANQWLDPQISPKRHGPSLADWAGDEWKTRIRESLAAKIEAFNTPNTKNTNDLFKRYLGISIKDSWSWQGVSADSAHVKLDGLITLRGSVVHRGKMAHPASTQLPDVRRKSVVDALNLLYHLVHATERALNVQPSP